MGQLQELNKQRPRANADEGMIAEMGRIESQLALAKDDLSAIKLKVTGLHDELKHVNRELKKVRPDVEQVCALR